MVSHMSRCPQDSSSEPEPSPWKATRTRCVTSVNRGPPTLRHGTAGTGAGQARTSHTVPAAEGLPGALRMSQHPVTIAASTPVGGHAVQSVAPRTFDRNVLIYWARARPLAAPGAPVGAAR